MGGKLDSLTPPPLFFGLLFFFSRLALGIERMPRDCPRIPGHALTKSGILRFGTTEGSPTLEWLQVELHCGQKDYRSIISIVITDFMIFSFLAVERLYIARNELCPAFTILKMNR